MKTKTFKCDDPLDELVLTALAGDEGAWGSFIEKTGPRLIAYLAARGNLDDAEDAAQNAWSNAWQKASTFDPGDSPAANLRGFVFRIGINQLISIQRRKRAKSLGDDFDLESRDRPNDENLLLQEQLEIIRECIEALPEAQRTVMLMRMKMSESEVVAALEIQSGTAASRYSRARKDVGACIERKLNGGRQA